MRLLQPLVLAILFLGVGQANSQDNTQKTTVVGQVVCSLCWFEADRTTTPFGSPHEIECARECEEKGIPSAVALADGDDFKLYLLREGRIKKEVARTDR